MVSALDISNTEDKGFVYSPLFFVRGGYINGRTLRYAGYLGIYWSSTVQSDTYVRNLRFDSGASSARDSSDRYLAFSLRCLALYPATGDKGFTARPLFFVRGGSINNRNLNNAGRTGNYLSSTVQSSTSIYNLNFNSGGSDTRASNYRYLGFFLRCQPADGPT